MKLREGGSEGGSERESRVATVIPCRHGLLISLITWQIADEGDPNIGLPLKSRQKRETIDVKRTTEANLQVR